MELGEGSQLFFCGLDYRSLHKFWLFREVVQTFENSLHKTAKFPKLVQTIDLALTFATKKARTRVPAPLQVSSIIPQSFGGIGGGTFDDGSEFGSFIRLHPLG